MRVAVLTALATISLLGACRQPDTQANNSAPRNVTSDDASANSVTPAATPVSAERAQQLFHERHEGMEKVGKANKTIRQQLESGSPDLAVVRSDDRGSCLQVIGLVPRGHRAGRASKDPRTPGDLAETRGFRREGSTVQRGRAGFQGGRGWRRRERHEVALRRPRQDMQGVPRHLSCRRTSQVDRTRRSGRRSGICR